MPVLIHIAGPSVGGRLAQRPPHGQVARARGKGAPRAARGVPGGPLIPRPAGPVQRSQPHTAAIQPPRLWRGVPAPALPPSTCHVFADQEECTTGDYEEIMNKASCLSPVSNAVLYWNTIKITDIVEDLRLQGEEIDDDTLSYISLLPFKHVVPNGTYFIENMEQG